jgi:hypothetical protein
MRDLDRFIMAAKERGAEFAQDFPPDCVPIECGRLTAPIEAYVSADGRFTAVS